MPPQIIRSRVEGICGPILTVGVPYQWYSAYYLALPTDLVPGNVIQVASTFEVTNPYPFNVQLDRYISLGTSWGQTAQPLPFCPITGSNVTPDIHHLRDTVFAVIDDALLASLGLSWANLNGKFISLTLSAASTMAQPGQALVLDHGYGELIATIFR